MTRLPVLLLAVASLIVGIWSGLVRAGVTLAPPTAEALTAHGALMVGAALGTLISLERAVALGERWAYLAPLASGLAGASAALGAPLSWVTSSLVVASAVFVLVNVRIVLRQRALFTVVMGMGALAWLLGNVAWATGLPVYRLVLAWVSFLVLTIAGERLELSRLHAAPDWAVQAFGVIVGVLLLGSALLCAGIEIGARAAGLALVALAVWLVRYDIARRTLRSGRLPRFIAVCLLSGYIWLGVGGVLLTGTGELTPGLSYDAILHTLLLGFVFSMIFGHAPVILPAVIGVNVPFSTGLYVPLAALHSTVALRVAADLSQAADLRGSAAVLNVLALSSYLLVVLFSKLRAALAPRRQREAALAATDHARCCPEPTSLRD